MTNRFHTPRKDGDMKKIGILYSNSGDWVGLYIDGKLIAEGHSISECDMVKLLLPKCDLKEVSNDAMNESGRCPANWSKEWEK